MCNFQTLASVGSAVEHLNNGGSALDLLPVKAKRVATLFRDGAESGVNPSVTALVGVTGQTPESIREQLATLNDLGIVTRCGGGAQRPRYRFHHVPTFADIERNAALEEERQAKRDCLELLGVDSTYDINWRELRKVLSS